MEKYDFSGWATRANLKCSDGRVIMKDAFKHCDGQKVPLVWNHQHDSSFSILGHALLENRDEGVYAYGTFNDTESGQNAKLLVKHGDVVALSIYANQLKQQGSNVIHGAIREVSLVLAGANPGASIDSIIIHAEDSDDEAIIYNGEDIMLFHGDDKKNIEETLQHASNEEETKKEEPKKEENKEEEPKMAEETKKKVEGEETVADVFETLTDKQKTVVYALIGQALEDAGVSDEDDDDEEVEHSEGGTFMKHNVFDNEEINTGVLSHADQQAIINMAKQSSVGSLQQAIKMYAEEHGNTLAHGIDNIGALFPDFKDLKPGAPELLERDMGWVGQVMKKAHKSPVSRVRTRQADARAAEVRAKGYTNRESEKTISGNIRMIMRTTDPQTVYFRDELHRDDIVDITDFDVVAYQQNVMRHNLEEEIAKAALIGDGRSDGDPDKISETHIHSVWHDEDIYTIKATVDTATTAAKLQGTNTGANFGENFIFAEAFLESFLFAREQYKGKGVGDLYCTPRLLNKMLLARDMNGRRIYDSAEDLAKAMNVGAIYTVEQMEGLTRTDDDDNKFKLLGIFVNMNNYTFGATKGGEITSFDQFDLDFNKQKFLMEARLSGALTELYSAIALEEPVVETAG